MASSSLWAGCVTQKRVCKEIIENTKVTPQDSTLRVALLDECIDKLKREYVSMPPPRS